jgi:hypothetical protein
VASDGGSSDTELLLYLEEDDDQERWVGPLLGCTSRREEESWAGNGPKTEKGSFFERGFGAYEAFTFRILSFLKSHTFMSSKIWC